MDSWGTLFERAVTVETDVPAIRDRLAAQRGDEGEPDGGPDRSKSGNRDDSGYQDDDDE
ncbi:hypothetical protein [Halorhabdus rudnickae]|uniref:hypothetical protein n=1 Tax=Halorhabdus rudnickae TaxID=1775544 RepID=UPI0014386545|nr:hypothetical protein [Halorhabdus rudnickae]